MVRDEAVSVMSDDNTTTVRTTLENHPRMIGVLFTTMLLLSQAGSAMAAAGSTIDCFAGIGC